MYVCIELQRNNTKTTKMKTTKHNDLQSLVTELQRQSLQKRDFIIPSNLISMKNGEILVQDGKENQQLSKILKDSGISYQNGGATETLKLFPLETCHTQLSEKLQIPKKYYDRMTGGNTDILDYSVSYWMQRFGKNCLLRTFIDKDQNAGYARAVLSDRFKVIDNFDLILACLEAIKDLGHAPDFIQIADADITDKRMYVRFICPSIEVQAPELLLKSIVPGEGPNTNMGIISGFVISNSEIGFGQYSISPRAHILTCNNGRIFKDDNFSQVHLGGKMEEYSYINWSEETKQKNYQLIISQIKDAIKKFMSQEYLREKVNHMIEKETKSIAHPVDCIKNVCASLQVGEEKQKTILDYFIKGGEANVFNLTQAMTFFAHKNAEPDERFELEVAASKVADNIEKFDRVWEGDNTPQISLKLGLN